MNVKSMLIDRSFSLFEHMGIHITESHFYQPIPDTRFINPDLWENHSKLTGIEINDAIQLQLLSDFSLKYKSEYDKIPIHKTSTPHEYYINNPNFNSVDAEILYCMIRHFKPNKVIEIGSGYTTFLSAQAIQKNKAEDPHYECELIAIEPYPNRELLTGFPGLTQLIQKKLEDVQLSVFDELKENDILFIDSSHVLTIGNDVYIEYLKILPNLNQGVIIHIHDIFLPAEYPKKWIYKLHRFWNEQYLLQAFLTFNDSFRILWAAHYMHIRYPDKLKAAFRSYDKNIVTPGSFWMKKTPKCQL